MLDRPVESRAPAERRPNVRQAPVSGEPIEPEGMTITALLAALRRRRWVLILCALLFPAVALIAAKNLTPRYTASTSVLYETAELPGSRAARHAVARKHHRRGYRQPGRGDPRPVGHAPGRAAIQPRRSAGILLVAARRPARGDPLVPPAGRPGAAALGDLARPRGAGRARAAGGDAAQGRRGDQRRRGSARPPDRAGGPELAGAADPVHLRGPAARRATWRTWSRTSTSPTSSKRSSTRSAAPTTGWTARWRSSGRSCNRRSRRSRRSGPPPASGPAPTPGRSRPSRSPSSTPT